MLSDILTFVLSDILCIFDETIQLNCIDYLRYCFIEAILSLEAMKLTRRLRISHLNVERQDKNSKTIIYF